MTFRQHRPLDAPLEKGASSCSRKGLGGLKASWSSLVLHPMVALLLRTGLGLVFAVSGALKLADLHGFADIIVSYGLVPLPLIDAVAIGLPALELLAGLGLILDIRGSLGTILGLLLLFCLVLWFGIIQELTIDCGCFSSEEIVEQNSLRRAFYRDLVFLGAAAFLYFWRWKAGRQPRSVGDLWRMLSKQRS
jgi:uncharacterized membrane protein YphA (DoxX/SURF4 family)